MPIVNESGQVVAVTVEQAREHIARFLAGGAENIAAEVVTIFGLEAEYPELIAKVDAEAAP